jgi:TetR/AcrR family transcriptional regulator
MPTRRNAARTRATILAAAQKEFERGGFAGTRISAIARRAGVNTSLVFYYFQSKDGLYRALSDDRMDVYALPNGNPDTPDDLLRWPEWLFELGDTREAVRYLMREAIADSGSRTPLPDEERRRASFQQQVERVRQAQAAGRLPCEFDAAQLTLFLYMLGVYPYMLPQFAHLIAGAAPDDPTFSTRFEAFLSDLADVVAPRRSEPA